MNDSDIGHVEAGHENDSDGDIDDVVAIPCSRCGRPTSFDPTYGNLCYRCCRASNE